jgi:hypothetical protein
MRPAVIALEDFQTSAKIKRPACSEAGRSANLDEKAMEETMTQSDQKLLKRARSLRKNAP